MKRPGFRQVWGQALERLGQGPLPAVTVLVGEEPFVKERLIEAARATWDGPVSTFAIQPGEQDARARDRLFDLCGTADLFGGAELILVRDAAPLLKGKGAERLAALVEDGSSPHRLLLTLPSLDGRTKLAKLLKAGEGLVQLPVLRDAPPPWHDGGPYLNTDLNEWVVAEAACRGLTVPLTVADALTRRTGNEPGRIASHLSQLEVLLEGRQTLEEQDVARWVPRSSVRLFDLYEDALRGGRGAEALALVDRMQRDGVHDPFQRLVTGPAVADTVLRQLVTRFARELDAHERLGPELVGALSAKPWERRKDQTAALDSVLGKGGARVFLERDLRRTSGPAVRVAFRRTLAALRRLRDGDGASLHAETVRLARALAPRRRARA